MVAIRFVCLKNAKNHKFVYNLEFLHLMQVPSMVLRSFTILSGLNSNLRVFNQGVQLGKNVIFYRNIHAVRKNQNFAQTKLNFLWLEMRVLSIIAINFKMLLVLSANLQILKRKCALGRKPKFLAPHFFSYKNQNFAISQLNFLELYIKVSSMILANSAMLQFQIQSYKFWRKSVHFEENIFNSTSSRQKSKICVTRTKFPLVVDSRIFCDRRKFHGDRGFEFKLTNFKGRVCTGDKKASFLARHLWSLQKSEFYANWTKFPQVVDSSILRWLSQIRR